MNRQTVLIIVFVLILAGVGVVWYRSSQTPATAETRAVGEGTALRLEKLRRLKTVELDLTLLKDPFFRSLEIPERVVTSAAETPSLGRPNPFLPF